MPYGCTARIHNNYTNTQELIKKRKWHDVATVQQMRQMNPLMATVLDL